MPSPLVRVSGEVGDAKAGLNYASQDYLALSGDPRIRAAAQATLDTYGPHSAGSPILQGNTPEGLALEQEIGEALGYRHVMLFPTGWAAGFGAVAGLARCDDFVVLDQYAHNCLVVGAEASKATVSRVRHLDLDGCESRLRKIRSTAAKAAILVATEGLFSMDADSPDLCALRDVCNRFDATLLVDVAHDFGSMGPRGTGLLGASNLLGKVDLVVGSFSKTFASNGGFLATNSAAVRQYVKACASPHLFSNAISALQCSVVRSALAVVRSPEGDRRRATLSAAIGGLRSAFVRRGIHCLGQASPIVPVPLGPAPRARITASSCFQRGLFANLVEYPAVSKGEARFRMQVMASHTPEQGEQAAGIVCEALDQARVAAIGSGETFRP
jgi:7-keto-8-aminopelargonate synthetase-like enzyme